MNRAFFSKVIGVFILTILMSWAVSYVNSLILERQNRQEEVKYEIARSSAGSQTMTGPVLAVPYYEDYPVTTTENKISKTEIFREQHTAYFLPENLELIGGFSNESKKLGIYKALMYLLSGTVKGSFNLPANFNVTAVRPGGKVTFLPAYLSLGLSDTRGISGKPVLIWNSQTYKFEQGSNTALGNGIHATVGKFEVSQAQKFAFEFTLNLQGMENFSFAPIAENNSIALQSSWRHPHFNGSFLPVTKQINDAGFSGKWAVSSLASTNQTALMAVLNGGEKSPALEALSIGFIEPINVYSQSDRATKYGLLFIGLTFVGFFIFETLKRLRIHPAQYTFVGLGMALFYLLLISLAEHISFAWAYFAASLSCVSLLGYYLSFVLKSKSHGWVFAGLLTALYSALYGILASEDNALLMGSLLVFGLLAITMIITRKVDWYQISNSTQYQA